MSIHVVNRDGTGTNSDHGATDVTVSESNAAATVFKEASGSWGSGATSQSTGTDSTGVIPQPDADGAIRIREYSQTSSATTYYEYNVAVASQAGPPKFASYDYTRDYGDNFTLTANTLPCAPTTPACKVIGSSWYRDSIATTTH